MLPNEENKLTAKQFVELVAQYRHSERGSDFVGALTCGTLCYAVLCGVVLLLGTRAWSILIGVPCSITICLIAARLVKGQVHRIDRHVDDLIRFINRANDPKLIGSILDLARSFDTNYRAFLEVRSACDHALTRLLPKLQEADTDVLNTRQRELLREPMFEVMSWSGNPPGISMGHDPYTKLVLEALEKIGDRRDLSDIQKLIDHHLLRDDDIRTLARRVADVISERSAGGSDASTLLRPGNNLEQSDELLRAAQKSSDTKQSELLRPGETNIGD
jgi:hypothetical protein